MREEGTGDEMRAEQLPLLEAFQQKRRYEVSNTGCHVWQGPRNNTGYGMFYYRGKNLLAHRLAWRAVNGPIPDGLFVMHKCDNPPCINPEHLMIGTAADNARDMVEKGRSTRGRRYERVRGSAPTTYRGKRYASDPEFRDKAKAATRRWEHENAEYVSVWRRDWRRRKQKVDPQWQAKQQQRLDRMRETEKRAYLRSTCYSMAEIAKLAGVHPSTVTRWAANGELQFDPQAEKLGMRLVAPDFLFTFLAQRNSA